MKRFVRVGGMILVVMAILTIGATLWDNYSSRRVAAQYPPSGEFVQVGDARMHVIC